MSKAHGTKDKIVGAIKQKTGHLVGNKELEEKGSEQRGEGTAEKEEAREKELVKEYADNHLGKEEKQEVLESDGQNKKVIGRIVDDRNLNKN
eukprot:TRINITY_DN14175_c0_g1_i1.p1 TRINITY_DN14175_c0_g1~~TRINITY_DN14175_c0_g1_i1.p1  ORF type:complete len:106 (-),score=43.00 TRINITY_DN14175_c0_g1_i1:78-353(-)